MNRKRVLIVDDDKDFAQSLVDLVEGQGFDTTCVSSGTEAVKLFDRESFDLTFVDIKMPGMDGVECLIKIREKKPGAKVIMATGYSAASLQGQAKNHGAIDVLNKPLSLELLFKTLDQVKAGDLIRPVQPE